MKILLFVFMAALTALLTGCNTRYVDVRGEKFEMISESEERDLVKQARLSLKTISKRIPPADMKVIDTTDPELRFIYAGDRYGRAIVRWHFPSYEAGVDYEGQLMTKHMLATVFTKPKQAEISDFRGKSNYRRAFPDRGRKNTKQRRIRP